MEKVPIVGILMATFNGERFLRQQIESILFQSYSNWKLLIHDDGSEDNTLPLLRHYAKNYPDKIILVEDGIKCGGAKENFSHLFNIVKSEFDFDYIMFSDQDDVWLPNKVEITLKKMLEVDSRYKGKSIIVHTDLKVVDANLNVVADSFWQYQKINPWHNSLACLLLENTVTGCTMMINKALFEKIVFFPAEAIIHDWWIALVCSALDGYIIPIEESTVLYRQHGKNDTGAKDYSILASLQRFITNPPKMLRRATNMGIKIRKQAKALIQYINDYFPNQVEFLSLLEDVLENPLKRRVFYLREGCLCGTFIKKLGKLLFY